MYITYNNLIRFSGALNAPRMAVPKGVRGISLVRQMKLSLQRWEWKKKEEEGEKKRRRRRKKVSTIRGKAIEGWGDDIGI